MGQSRCRQPVAGKVSGAGVFDSATPVTVRAEPLPGYLFLDWTENGAPVSTTANYTFTSDQPRLLTARFVALPTVTVHPAATPDPLALTGPDAPGWLPLESGNLAGRAAAAPSAATSCAGQRLMGRILLQPTEGKPFGGVQSSSCKAAQLSVLSDADKRPAAPF